MRQSLTGLSIAALVLLDIIRSSRLGFCASSRACCLAIDSTADLCVWCRVLCRTREPYNCFRRSLHRMRIAVSFAPWIVLAECDMSGGHIEIMLHHDCWAHASAHHFFSHHDRSAHASAHHNSIHHRLAVSVLWCDSLPCSGARYGNPAFCRTANPASNHVRRIPRLFVGHKNT